MTTTTLQLLHPRGYASSVRVVGRGCPTAFGLCPDQTRPRGSADLVVLAPDAQELAEPGWLEKAVEDAVGALNPDGLIYAVVQRRTAAQLRRQLAACGLAVVQTVLHHPSLPEAQTIIPLEWPSLAYAYGRLVRTHPVRRSLALGLMRLPGVLSWIGGTLPAVGLLAQRPGSRAPASWFTDLVRPDPHLSAGAEAPQLAGVVVHSSWRGPEGAVLLHGIDAAGGPLAIAKTWSGPNGEAAVAQEADALAHVAAPAGAYGVAVPALIGRGHLGPQPFLAESAVTGERASVVLQERPGQLPALLAQLTAWLTDWAAAAHRSVTLTRPMLDAHLLAPAAQLGLLDDYRGRLHALCDRLEGATVPLVPSHGDLTMVNVLVGPGLRLGVIDWETAAPAGLPLADFFYAAVDAVAALDDYRDRSAAYASCFLPGGQHRALVESLQARLVDRLALTPDQVALSFHANWLNCALNERRETAKAVPDEFLHIARLAARDGEADEG